MNQSKASLDQSTNRDQWTLIDVNYTIDMTNSKKQATIKEGRLKDF